MLAASTKTRMPIGSPVWNPSPLSLRVPRKPATASSRNGACAFETVKRLPNANFAGAPSLKVYEMSVRVALSDVVSTLSSIE